jgi:hypothetical protein
MFLSYEQWHSTNSFFVPRAMTFYQQFLCPKSNDILPTVSFWSINQKQANAEQDNAEQDNAEQAWDWVLYWNLTNPYFSNHAHMTQIYTKEGDAHNMSML